MNLTILEDHLEEQKERFASIDGAINALKTRETELKEKISTLSANYGIETAQTLAALRLELTEIGASLKRAAERRAEMTAENAENTISGLIATATAAIQKEHAEQVNELWDAATDLRRRVWALDKADDAAQAAIRAAVKRLRPYYPDLPQSLFLPRIIPLFAHSGVNRRVIDAAEDERPENAREFEN